MRRQNKVGLVCGGRKVVRNGLLVALVGLWPGLTRGQIAVQEWVQRYNGPGNGEDSARAIAVDGSNNVIVTGYSASTNAYPYNHDYITIKYSSAGVPLWTNRYNGPGNGEDQASAVAVDGSNNVIVTGHSDVDGYGTNYDYATIKYSSAGVPLWTNRYDGPANSGDYAYAVVVDASGNAYVTGPSVSRKGSLYHPDYATIAYSSAGVPLWTNRYIGPGLGGGDVPLAVGVDPTGNVYVTGRSDELGYGDDDYATLKYSGVGVPLWTNRYIGPLLGGDDEARAIAVDASGNVYVTGYSPSTHGFDYATIKYSSEGVPLWTNRYDGPASYNDRAYAIAVDASGNVIVTGYSYASLFDYATIKYSSAGVPLWTNRYSGVGHSANCAQAVVLDPSGTVYVTGYSAGTETDINYDYATIAYSSAGVPLWTNRYNGPADNDDYANAIAVDTSGNVFVTGRSWNGSNHDFATIKYAVLPPIPLEVQRVADQLVLSWTNAAFHLQSAPAVTGVFTNLPTATSPWTNPITGDQQYFRLISN